MGRSLNLVEDEDTISQTLRLFRITLLGPTREELLDWRTETELIKAWITASGELALNDGSGKTIAIEEFFNLFSFENDTARVDEQSIVRVARDVIEVHSRGLVTQIDLNGDAKLSPPYPLEPNYVPGELAKLGIEVRGGDSGFTPSEPCTRLALGYNSEYMVIDCIPLMDEHLFARRISKNQLSFSQAPCRVAS